MIHLGLEVKVKSYVEKQTRFKAKMFIKTRIMFKTKAVRFQGNLGLKCLDPLRISVVHHEVVTSKG